MGENTLIYAVIIIGYFVLLTWFGHMGQCRFRYWISKHDLPCWTLFHYVHFRRVFFRQLLDAVFGIQTTNA